MQTPILIISLVLMGATLAIVLRSVLATDGPAPGPKANTARLGLLWGLIVLGVLVSVASLRDGPHPVAGPDAMVVRVTSGQWWWEIDTYEIPAGQEVEFRVTTEDVNHGLGIYDPNMRLVAQVQAMPGYENDLVVTFDMPGTYRILCMEFCGIAHHDMINEFDVVEG